MDHNVFKYERKIRKLLAKYAKPSVRLNSDIPLNLFLSYLSGEKRGDFDRKALLNLPIFLEWLIKIVTDWENSVIRPSPFVVCFALKLCGLLAEDEQKFIILEENKVVYKIFKVFQLTERATPTVIKLSSLSLLRGCLNHNKGTQWLMTTKYWEDFLRANYVDTQSDFLHQIRADTAIFIEKLIDYNEAFCVDVIERIMNPLSESTFKAFQSTGKCLGLTEDILYCNLKPTLKLVSFILRYLLETCYINNNDLRVACIFIRHYKLDICIHNYLDIALNKDFIFDLSRISYIVQFLELCIKAKNNHFTGSDVKEALQNVMDIYKINVEKGDIESVLHLCYFGLSFWQKMSTKIPKVDFRTNKDTITFEQQLVLLQILPVCLVCIRYCSSESRWEEVLGSDEVRDVYITKLLSSCSESTLRLCFMFKNVLTTRLNEVFEFAVKALHYILESRKCYEKEQAIFVFQSMVYCLKDYIILSTARSDVLETCLKEVKFFELLFSVIIMFIEDYSITWRESLESTCVVSDSIEFLTLASWKSKIVVKALKLMNISIAKYMAPNLALLVDRTTDSNMALISPLLYAKLHDTCWEVRDSALEVLCTISNLSNTKFSSFQKIVLETELPTLVVKMAMNDGQTFVRATALKCLRQMIEVSKFWDELLKLENLPENMIKILQNDPDGLVRKEAASLLCGIYQFQGFPEEVLPQIYEIMIYSATKDLHWEVEIEALKFWEIVIKNHLQNQGMIDGSFPSVTFSKENRKIVNLTEMEISKRLQKTLVQLSEIGCLGVLVAAIQDDDDIEVSKAAINITQNFLSILRNYNINANNVLNNIPQSPTSDLSYSPLSSSSSSIVSDKPSTSKTEFSEEVMDHIVNTNDMNLLQNVYSPSVSSPASTVQIGCKKTVTPSDFLNFTSQDLDQLLNERKKWLRGIDELGSLLDDMLKNYSDEEVNSMDCY